MFGLHWQLMDKTSRRLWLMENRDFMYGCFGGDGDGDGGGDGPAGVGYGGVEADGPVGSGLGPGDTATTDGGNIGSSVGGDEPGDDPDSGFGLGPPGGGFVGVDPLGDVDVSVDTVSDMYGGGDSLADSISNFFYSPTVGLTMSQHQSFISNVDKFSMSSPTGFSPFGTPTNVMAMDMSRPDFSVIGIEAEVPMAEQVPGMLAGLATGAFVSGPFAPAVSAVSSSVVDSLMGLPVDVSSVVGKAVGNVVGSQISGAVAPAVAQSIYGSTQSIPGAIAGGVVAGGLAGGAAGSLAGGFAESVADEAISGSITGSSTTSVDPSSAAPSGSSGTTEQAEQSGISVTGYAESAANNNTSSNAMSGGTTPGVDTSSVADTAESTTSFGISGVSDSATFGQTSGRQTYGGRSFGGGQFAGSQFTGGQFGGYSPTVQFSAEGGQVAQQGMQRRKPAFKDILDEVGQDVYTLSKFGYKPTESEIKQSTSSRLDPRLKDPLKENLSFLTAKERKQYSKGYVPVGDILLSEIGRFVRPKSQRQNYAEGGTVQDPTMVGQPETRETLSPNNVADDVPMNGEDGGFVINAPAVAQSGKMYIQDLINEATDSLRAKGNRVLTQAGKEVDEDVVPLMVSEGEVYLPPEIAEEIGISRLEKINNRGKKKVAKLQKQAEEQAPREGFVAAPA